MKIHTTSIRMARQQVWEGPVPYIGSFEPYSLGSKIINIHFPMESPPVLLVKAGHSTEECTDPGAVILVHGDMTPSQMEQVWGTSDIQLHSESLHFVGCAATTQPLRFLPVEVTWHALGV